MSTLILEPVRTVHVARTGAPARPVAAGTRSGGLRLTRRGRLVVFVASLLVALAAGVLWAAGSMATQQAGQPEQTEIVVVRSGQTLWSIAAEHAVDGDVTGMVRHLQELNGFDGGVVRAGQRLAVPVD
ncbi:LysM peptidoglycan-binding domain-containing protein [Nocardioides sp. TRM66260-LWL]|uniref:LysM peptidoglycan-binding domain-containing protein n=1 Tax=Nocardioides sp. TRM66260-LWL TaxID=2874478 RepID=UPI001CC55222|nr:LysM peptidoglycan-binding domain-containing protein [Nocardioides sp. TRM66260-LWL]MBZ5735008.1 LysM peptidoglycan-binding domain-containing protein [Nocardioides sp. TRM66260-LWL]